MNHRTGHIQTDGLVDLSFVTSFRLFDATGVRSPEVLPVEGGKEKDRLGLGNRGVAVVSV